MDKKITILITDDHPIVRSGIRSALENALDMLVVGEAQDGNEAQRLIAELHPNILLLDLKMPGFSAVEVEKWVRVNYPETVVLVLTAHDRDFYLAGMMDAGAAGYLTKNKRGKNLIAGIRRAASGERLFTQEQLERARRWRETAGQGGKPDRARARNTKTVIRWIEQRGYCKNAWHNAKDSCLPYHKHFGKA